MLLLEYYYISKFSYILKYWRTVTDLVNDLFKFNKENIAHYLKISYYSKA